MSKIKVVELEKLYNFVVENFLIWIRLGLQNSIWNFLYRVFFLHSAKRVFAKCQIKHSAKKIFVKCQKTLGKETSLSSVKKTRQSGFFAECFIVLFNTQQRSLFVEYQKNTAKSFFNRVFFLWYCSLPSAKKHSVNLLTLGKESDSGSVQGPFWGRSTTM